MNVSRCCWFSFPNSQGVALDCTELARAKEKKAEVPSTPTSCYCHPLHNRLESLHEQPGFRDSPAKRKVSVAKQGQTPHHSPPEHHRSQWSRLSHVTHSLKCRDWKLVWICKKPVTSFQAVCSPYLDIRPVLHLATTECAQSSNAVRGYQIHCISPPSQRHDGVLIHTFLSTTLMCTYKNHSPSNIYTEPSYS